MALRCRLCALNMLVVRHFRRLLLLRTYRWRPLALLAVRGLVRVHASRQRVRFIGESPRLCYVSEASGACRELLNGEQPLFDRLSRRVPALSTSRGSASGNLVLSEVPAHPWCLGFVRIVNCRWVSGIRFVSRR